MTSVRRVVVTGAGGFVGANLTRRLLEEGHVVVAVERPGSPSNRLHDLDIDRRPVDLRDADAVRGLITATRPEHVFHTAAHGAYSWQSDRGAIVASNVLGTANLVEACLESDCQAFVHTGTSSEYGAVDHAPSEDEAPAPATVYAATKAAATLYTGAAGRRSGRRFVTLRLYSVYGPWEDDRRFVPALVRAGLQGELPPLVQPDVAHDYVYVDDVVDALLAAADAERSVAGAVYNVGTGVQTTIREIVALCRALLGTVEEPRWGTMADREWDSETWIADTRRAAAELGWHPTRSLEEGLRATIDWQRSRARADGTR